MSQAYFSEIQEYTNSVNLSKPPFWTWRKYLEELGRLASIEEGKTSYLINEGEQARFGHTESSPPDSVMSQWMDKLKEFIQSDQTEHASIVNSFRSSLHMDKTLGTSESPTPIRSPAPTPQEMPVEIEPYFPEEIDPIEHSSTSSRDTSVSLPSSSSNSIFTSKLFVSFILINWTIASLVVGIFHRHFFIKWLPLEVKRYIITEQERSQRFLGTKKYDLEKYRIKLASAPISESQYEWLNYAFNAEKRNYYGEAILAYRRILSDNPKDLNALIRLGWLHLTAEHEYARDPYEAFRLIEKARTIELTSWNQNSYSLLRASAECQFQLQNYETAVTEMKAAIKARGQVRGYHSRMMKAALSKYENALANPNQVTNEESYSKIDLLRRRHRGPQQ